jgi:hypothetical protein
MLQQIEKRSHHHWTISKDSSSSCCEHPNPSQGYSHKSKKALRYQISPDTSSLLNKGITGKSKSKINLNLNNKIISKPVFSKI